MSELLFSKIRNFSVTFPENMFGLNHVAADKYKKDCELNGRPFDENKYKKMVQPYSALYFENNTAKVASSEDEATVDMPWTFDMVKELRAYKEGSIRAQTLEQKEIARKASGIEDAIPPEDFEENFARHRKAYDALCKVFKAEMKEECDRYIKTIKEHIIQPFSVVNVALPEYKNNVPKYVKSINRKREDLVDLIEPFFIK